MTVTDDILVKVISGNATVDEVKLITEWINTLPQNKNHYDSLKIIWENSKPSELVFKPDINKAWNNVSEKINQPKLFSIIRIAAGLLIIICVSVILKFIVFNSTSPNQKVISDKARKNEIDINNITVDTILPRIKAHIIKRYNIATLDSLKEFFLPDSSLVLLNKNSEINYKDFFASNKRMLYLDGQAHFDIIPNKKDFIVVTDFVIVKVIGTSFLIEENKEEKTVDVMVEEGVVEAFEAQKSKNKVMIKANEKYTYDILTHTFTKNSHVKKGKWRKDFFSKLRHIINRIKHRKHNKE